LRLCKTVRGSGDRSVVRFGGVVVEQLTVFFV
jgi:hypothetical protein